MTAPLTTSDTTHTKDRGLLRGLRGNMGLAFIGQFFYSLSQYLLIIIVSKMGGVNEVGTLILAFSVSAPVIMFCNLRLNLLLISDTVQRNDFFDYFLLRLLMTAIGLIVILLISWYFYPQFFLIILFITIAKCFEALSDICLAFVQKHELNRYISISQMLKGWVMLLGFFLGYELTHELKLASLFFCIGWALIFCCYDLRIVAKVATRSVSLSAFYQKTKQEIKARLLLVKLKQLFILGLPLSLVAGLNSLNTNMPRYLVEKLLGHDMLGYFAPPNYIFNTSLVIVNMLLLPALPKMTKYFNQHERLLLWRLVSFLLLVVSAIGLIGVVAAYFFGDSFIELFFGATYRNSGNLLFWYAIAAWLNYLALIFLFLLIVIRRLKAQVIIFAITLLLTMVFCRVLIPWYQLTGAVIGEILSGVFLTVASFMTAGIFILKEIQKSDYKETKISQLTMEL